MATSLGGVIRSEVRSQGKLPGQHTLDPIECLDQTLPRALTINITGAYPTPKNLVVTSAIV